MLSTSENNNMKMEPATLSSPTKHPLRNQWTLWYLDNDRNKSWEEKQNEVSTFDTVEDFWNLYNMIKYASELQPGNDYSLFKNNIRPMWEDAANANGGRWILSMTQQQLGNLDDLWLNVMLCLIGECLEYSDDINGAVVSIRPRTVRISIWTADSNNQDAIVGIGLILKQYLQLPSDIEMYYGKHEDTANKVTNKSLSLHV
ncbi:eukaryotic translation initiation factor 4E1-like [Bradysia coprophila]|uniref:eukaryotic translation initiation factor 4E1-like n=1 Tax=Bradysia coprophila TaxID=38358 RepID=UPI00187DB83A|nr:eukaryotic translation initiation factor 4E1-like [Bradysia coprophila]